MKYRPTILVRAPGHADAPHRAMLAIGDWRIPCVVGKNGLVPANLKREGDAATPIGIFPLRYGFYDPAAFPDFPKDLRFPFLPWDETIWWSEEPESADYNRLLYLDDSERCEERLRERRESRLFDMFIPVGFNDATPTAFGGSGIYIHAARPAMTGSAGCISIPHDQLIEFARRLEPGMVIDIAPGELPQEPQPVRVPSLATIRPRPNAPAPMEQVAFSALEKGPRLLVTGAVHGNEPCGPKAISRVIEEIRAGRIVITRGEVTFVPVVNRMAYLLNRREGDRNLNRDLREAPIPVDNEDRIANRLVPLMRRHEVLLDLHSFKGAGAPPFLFAGPRDNAEAIEPFRWEREETAFASILGVKMAMFGWLQVYAKAVEERARLSAQGIAPAALGGLPAGVAAGVGTTEQMRFLGGYAVTLECGQHEEEGAPEVGYRAILNALAHLGMVDAPPPPRTVEKAIELTSVELAHSPDDRLVRDFVTGEALKAGEPIARRASGELLTAPHDGYIVFPNKAPNALGEFFYYGVGSERFVR